MTAPGRVRRLAGPVGFAAAAYAFAATMAGTTMPTPLYPLYQRRFGFSELIITVIFATYAAGVIAALLVSGRLSDEIGRRPVLLAGLAFSALSAAAFLLAGGLALLLVGRVLSGVSAGIFTGTATATLVDLLGSERSDRATLGASVANMGGLGVGPLLAALVAGIAWPLRLPFWVDLALLVPAVGAIVLIEEPVPDAAPLRGARLRPQRLSVPAEMRPAFVSAALAGFAGFAVLGLSTAVSPAFLGQTLGVTSLVVVGLVVCAVFAASTGGQLLLEVMSPARAMPAGCAALIVGMALLALGLAETSLALLVIGEGVLAEVAGLRAAGLVFAAVVAAIAAVVLVLLARQRRDGAAMAAGR